MRGGAVRCWQVHLWGLHNTRRWISKANMKELEMEELTRGCHHKSVCTSLEDL